MRVCHPDADVHDSVIRGAHVRCVRDMALAGVEPLWELVDASRGAHWTVIVAPAAVELPRDVSGLRPAERALWEVLFHFADGTASRTLAAWVEPARCWRVLFSQRCVPPRAGHVATGVRDARHARELLEAEARRRGELPHSLTYAGEYVILAWTDEWADAHGLY